jgi:hypothetical protein
MLDSAGVDIDGIGVIHFPTHCAVVAVSPGLQFEWHAVTNRWYQPQYAASPDAPEPWTDLGPAVGGDGELHQVLFTNQTMAAAVFRVQRREAP